MWAPVETLSDDEQGGNNNKESQQNQKSAAAVMTAAKAAVESKTDVVDKTAVTTKKGKDASGSKENASSSKAKAKATVKSAASKKSAAKKSAANPKKSKDDAQETAESQDQESLEEEEPPPRKLETDDSELPIKRPASCKPKAKSGAMKRPSAAPKSKCTTKTKVYKYMYHKHNKYGFKKNKSEIMTVGGFIFDDFYCVYCSLQLLVKTILAPVRSKTLIRKFPLKDLPRLQLAAKIETADVFFCKPFQNYRPAQEICRESLEDDRPKEEVRDLAAAFIEFIFCQLACHFRIANFSSMSFDIRIRAFNLTPGSTNRC